MDVGFEKTSGALKNWGGGGWGWGGGSKITHYSIWSSYIQVYAVYASILKLYLFLVRFTIMREEHLGRK